MTGRTTWLATLRKRRRSIVLALCPAFILWAASGSACLAMLAASTAAPPQAEHSNHAQHADAQHGSHDTAPAPADCPHCPPGHHAADVGHGGCSAAGEVSANNAPIKTDTLGVAPPLANARWLTPHATAIPPLIALPAPPAAQPRATVPLGIRHCVFLI